MNSTGLSLSDGIRMFLYLVVNEHDIPFDPRGGKKPKTDLGEAVAKIEEETDFFEETY